MFTTSSYRLPPPLDEIDTPTSVVTNITLSDSDVYSELTSLDPTKSSGTDAIGPKLLKVGAIALYIPLHHVFKLCLSKCSIPSKWKIHRIIPIFKAGDKTSVQNYQPISLLCCVSKVLERLIFNKISDFVTQQIYPSQFVFLRGHSSVQQLLSFSAWSSTPWTTAFCVIQYIYTSKRRLTVCLIKSYCLNLDQLVEQAASGNGSKII